MGLRIGIVGMGGIGNLHAKCYKDDPLAELVAVCDIVKEKADKAAEDYGAKAYYSLKEMLSDIQLDIVDVTTSGYDNGSLHFEPAMEAIAAGKNVLVEKPICADIKDARELVTYAAKQKVYLGCNLNHYFTKTSEKGMDYIKNGKVGEVVYAMQKMGFNGGDILYGGPGSPRWQTPYSHLKAFLAHPFSVFRYFCGDISHVQAFLDRPGVRRTAGDPMLSINSIHLRFANGGVGYLISQRGDASFGLGGWWCFEMAGTKGTFAIENCVEKITYWGSPAESGFGMPEPEVFNTGITDFNSTFPNRLHAYLEDVTNGVPREYLRASGRDALATLEYTFAAIKSYENGGEVIIPEALPALHGDIKYVW